MREFYLFCLYSNTVVSTQINKQETFVHKPCKMQWDDLAELYKHKLQGLILLACH